MSKRRIKHVVFPLLPVLLVTLGLAPAASADMITSDYLVAEETQSATIDRIERALAEESVAAELKRYGVDPAVIGQRLQGLTAAELVTLEQRIDTAAAGGDALGIIGAVFLVLLILEVVGVTDIFKGV